MNNSFEMYFRLHYEILYINSGSVTITCDTGSFCLGKGDICIIPPTLAHKDVFTDANITKLLFKHSYLTKYFSTKILRSINVSVNNPISLATSDISDNTVKKLIESLKLHNGEGSYIFLLKLMNSRQNNAYSGYSPLSTSLYNIFKSSKNHLKEKNNLSVIACECNLSKSHICRTMKRSFGISPTDYNNYLKVKNAVLQLQTSSSTIAKISEDLSFSSPKYFTKIFKTFFGISPSQFRKNEPDTPGKNYYINHI